MKKRLVIGILAHVDSGKTTLSEALLFQTGQIKTLGRVDHKDAFLDTDNMEKNRGITIFSKEAIIENENMKVTLLDTPGHVDFSTEMERTLQVLDYAILVISGSDLIQSHTETLWRLLSRHQIPTFIFINKMDLAIKKKSEIISILRNRLDSGAIDFSREGEKEFYEEISLCNERLLEVFVETGKLEEEQIASSIKERNIFPCFFGSALKLEQTKELIEAIEKYTTSKQKEGKFGAKIFKISRDDKGERLTYLKITQGTLRVKDVLPTGEKVNQLRIYSGSKYQLADTVYAGDVCAITGLTNTKPGDCIGSAKPSKEAILEPVLTYRAILPKGTDSHTGLKYFKELEEEDPKLHVKWDENLEEIKVQLMGEMQLEILQTLMKTRFGVNLEFDRGNILYKETIKNKVEGVGHYEPLRHYAEVHLILEPGEEGSGLCFDSSCSEDLLDKNWQKQILSNLEERVHVGVLTGSPITDMKITLAAGKAHKKHTEGGDFRQATYRAVRQGLMQAESALLEPWYDFILEIPTEAIGRAMSDLNKMGGNFAPAENQEETSVIKGQCPVSEMMDYHRELAGYTKGRGKLSTISAGYKQCHNQDAVIEKISYEAERDVDNSANSIFCTAGAGVTVHWDQVFDNMSLESVLKPEKSDDFQAKVKKYGDVIADDKTLRAIFERTYGPIKEQRHKEAKIIKAKPTESIYIGRESQKNNFSGTEYLLIDGYNVIYGWEELNLLSKKDFGGARDALIDILCNYQGFREDCIVIVVFDAYKVKGNPGATEKVRNINVVYTKEAETADMYIEKVTHQIGRKHNVRVVTSDGLEQLIIMGHGALRISARAFQQEVLQIEEAIRDYLNKYK